MEMKEGGMETQIIHYSHRHPLTLRDEKSDEDTECSECKLPISDGPSYGCGLCKNLIVHKSCGEMPREIQHPFHRHPLTRNGFDIVTCEVCGWFCVEEYFFHCDNCRFTLDLSCASLVPAIKYVGHEHLLSFFDKIFRDNRCNACGIFCNGSLLCCMACDFYLHLECATLLLPQTIEHKCHIHSLNLREPLIEDDSGEYYCDACEEKRNAQLRIYYCEECEFKAHVKCAISEVLPSLFPQKKISIKEMEVKKKPITQKYSASDNMVDGGGFTNPAIVKFDKEIEKLCTDIETMTAKLETLKSERAALLEQLK